MHYFHLFLNIVLPFSLVMGVVCTVIGLCGPMDHPITEACRVNFLQVSRKGLMQAWQVWGVTFCYFVIGLCVLLYTSWTLVGNTLFLMTLFWLARNLCLMMFPHRAHLYNKISLSFKDGKLHSEMK